MARLLSHGKSCSSKFYSNGFSGIPLIGVMVMMAIVSFRGFHYLVAHVPELSSSSSSSASASASRFTKKVRMTQSPNNDYDYDDFDSNINDTVLISGEDDYYVDENDYYGDKIFTTDSPTPHPTIATGSSSNSNTNLTESDPSIFVTVATENDDANNNVISDTSTSTNNKNVNADNSTTTVFSLSPTPSMAPSDENNTDDYYYYYYDDHDSTNDNKNTDDYYYYDYDDYSPSSSPSSYPTAATTVPSFPPNTAATTIPSLPLTIAPQQSLDDNNKEGDTTTVTPILTAITKNDNEISMDKGQLELTLLISIFVVLLIVVWTVQQVKSNPQGLCAACCNVSYVATILFLKIVFFPITFLRRGCQSRRQQHRHEVDSITNEEFYGTGPVLEIT